MIRRFSDSLWRGLSPGPGRAKVWTLVAALALGLTAIAAMDSWRTAMAAAIAVGVVLATRIRFAPVVALILVALVATVAIGDAAPAGTRASTGGGSSLQRSRPSGSARTSGAPRLGYAGPRPSDLRP